MSKQPQISLCHATARMPLGWKPAAHAWFERADHPERIQYILGVDVGTVNEEEAQHWDEHFPAFGSVEIAVNCGRRCAVDGWNATAQTARGDLLITVADDWTPCEHWDTELLAVIGDLSREAVVDVSTGGNENLLTFSILTRAYFDRLTRDYGYNRGFFYAGDAKLELEGYIGMYADNEFDAFAKRDGVVLSAKRLLFPHDHPFYKAGGQMDEIHKRQHRPEAWHVGERVFRRRMQEFGFLTAEQKPIIAVLLPGEHFSCTWVSAWSMLFGYLLNHYRVMPVFGYSSNVYTTRLCLAEAAMQMFPVPQYVLWIDDDNIVGEKHFRQLMRDLEDNPDVDMVAGWCGINHQNVYRLTGEERVSCGFVSSDNKSRLLTRSEFLAGPNPLVPVGYTGFPCVLMRYGVLEKAGRLAFTPLLGEVFPWGHAGEDLAFCIRAREAGIKIMVDKRVRVAHLKLVPDFETDRLESVKKEEVA